MVEKDYTIGDLLTTKYIKEMKSFQYTKEEIVFLLSLQIKGLNLKQAKVKIK